MSITGKTSQSSLVTNALTKGTDSTTIGSSGMICDSSNNLTGVNTITTNSSNILNAYDNSGYTFSEGSDVPMSEYGMKFTTTTILTIKNLRHYFTTNQDTTNVIRLWNSVGTLLTSASTTTESVGWNNTADINYTLPVGTYVISFSVTSGYVPASSYVGGYPKTLNGITFTLPLYNSTRTQCPNINSGASYLYGLDLSMITSLIPIMSNGSETTNSTLLPLGHNLSPYRMLWGQVNGTTGALNYGSNGFKSVTRTALGMFDFVFEKPFIMK
jgi:hypothetical protein